MAKGRNIKSFLNSPSLFDVHRQYPWTFLINLQAEVSRFCCRIFHCFAYDFKIQKLYLNSNVFLIELDFV